MIDMFMEVECRFLGNFAHHTPPDGVVIALDQVIQNRQILELFCGIFGVKTIR
jgi:hypothetical protein